MDTNAMIHSLKDYAPAEIIGQYGTNCEYIAKYNGQHCTAIYNGFVGSYYVDDLYGRVTPEQAQKMLDNYARQTGAPVKNSSAASRKRDDFVR